MPCVWTVDGEVQPIGVADSDYTFANNANPYVSSTTASYSILGETLYPGGNITNIRVVAGSASATKYGAVKVYDRTHSLTIAEFTGIIGTERIIFNLGAITNSPGGQSVFEIQGKRIEAGGTLQISALRISH